MTRDDDMVETLTHLGQTQGPAPDPAFANRLDAHLRTLHAAQEPSRGIRSLVVISVLGVAGVVLAAVLSTTLIGREPAVVVLTAAAQTEVVLPGEAATQGVPGQRLPDGTRIVVSSGGEAVVGGVVLDQGTEAIVVGGRIEVLVVDDGDKEAGEIAATTRPVLRPEPADSLPPSSTPDRPDGTSPSTTGRPGASTAPSTTEPRPDDPVTSPTTAPGGDGPATTATTRPTTTSPPRTTASTRPTTTSSTRPTTTRGPSSTDGRPRPEPSIELSATATGDDRIVLTWTVEGVADPDRWRVEALAGDRVATLVVLRDGTARTATVARIDARRAGFRVVALDADDDPLLTSRIVTQPPA